MKLILLLLFFVISITAVSAKVVINEIMYDPEGADEGHEWIEIYSNEQTNLSGWKFYEDSSSHLLNLINGSWILKGYAVIVDDWLTFLEDYPAYNGTLIDSSWKSLSKNGESLALKNSSGEIVEEVNYSDSWGGKEISLERIDPVKPSNSLNWGNSLIPKGTPGQQNSLFGSCDWSILITTDDYIIDMQNETAVIKWKIKAEKNSGEGKIDISYWMENPFGEIVKSDVYLNTNISKTFGDYQKTFHESGGYIILANITNSSCKDFNQGNNFAKIPIIITGGKQGNNLAASNLQILSIPSSAEFGDVIRVDASIYKGDTSQYAIYAYVEDENGKVVSEKTTFYAKEKFVNYSLGIPVQLKPNCDEDYDNGNYNVVIEGLGLKDSEKIKIEGITSSLCKESSSSSSSSSSSTSSTSSGLGYEVLSKSYLLYPGSFFETEVRLSNNDHSDYDIDLWSYAYRGSKSYTGERESNKQSFVLEKGETKTINLENDLDQDIEPGDYNLKIKLRKNNQKTTKDQTYSIKVLDKKITEPKSIKEQGQNETLIAFQQEETNYSKDSNPYISYNPVTIYESSSYKSKKAIPFLIVSLSALLSLVLLLKI